jgi:choice-of-anchor B domain-containing protein
MEKKTLERAACEDAKECPLLLEALTTTPCSGGMAGEYPCKDVDLASFVPVDALGGDRGTNDIWGWTDPETGKEYALVGLVEGTSFVDITDPARPAVVGVIRSETYSSIWGDLKVHDNHVFIVSEAAAHGMQVFDLTRLRGITGRDATGVRPGAIKNRNVHGLCLEFAPAGLEHHLVRMQVCSDDNSAQNWTYDRNTGLVNNQHGLCLTAGYQVDESTPEPHT